MQNAEIIVSLKRNQKYWSLLKKIISLRIRSKHLIRYCLDRLCQIKIGNGKFRQFKISNRVEINFRS